MGKLLAGLGTMMVAYQGKQIHLPNYLEHHAQMQT
jgi:hypothetical protein